MTQLTSKKIRQAFGQPLGNNALLNAVKDPFESFVQAIHRREAVGSFGRDFIETVSKAAERPESLYRFFQLYNYLNAEIASTVASLVGNLGQSRNTFLDPAIRVQDEADYSFQLGKWVQKASTDEYEDPAHKDVKSGEGMSHRVLASGLLKAVGDYAKLTEKERASNIPDWLPDLTHRIQALYSGKKGDRLSLARAMGAHIFSEFSADSVEFSNACKILFVDNKGKGFHEYLATHPTITLGQNTFRTVAWLMTHGGYNEKTGTVEHGVEYVHLATGFVAAALAVTKARPKDRPALEREVLNGIHQCRGLLDEFFLRAKPECELVAKTAVLSAKRPIKIRGNLEASPRGAKTL